MSASLAGGVLIAVTVVLAGAGGLTFLSSGVPGRPATIDPPSAPIVTISEDGDSPTGLSLVATLSGSLCFSGQQNWTIYWSTVGPNGPWHEFESLVLGAYHVTEGVSDLVSGATYWWNATVRAPCSGLAYSNTLRFTQPSTAVLNDTLTSPTSVILRWDNFAAYGGQVSFGSYTVQRSINDGIWTPIATFSNASSTSDNVSGLSPGTDYAFEINTTDVISGADASTLSNQVLVSSSSVTSSGTATAGLSFGDWALIGLGAAVAALMTIMVLAVRRKTKPPEVPVEFRPVEGLPRPPSPPAG